MVAASLGQYWMRLGLSWQLRRLSTILSWSLLLTWRAAVPLVVIKLSIQTNGKVHQSCLNLGCGQSKCFDSIAHMVRVWTVCCSTFAKQSKLGGDILHMRMHHRLFAEQRSF